jgi:hypothetical protein
MAKVLSLDELFGKEEPIEITYKSRTYQMKVPSAMGPAEMLALGEAKRHYEALLSRTRGKGEEEITPEQAEEISRLASRMIEILAPELAQQGLTFGMQVKVLEFYSEEMQPNLPKAEEKQTGETSTLA